MGLPFMTKSRETLTLHFTGEGLRMALSVNVLGGKQQVVYLASLKVQDVAGQEIHQKFQKVLSELKLKNPRIVGVVPSEWAVTRTIEIPSRDPSEIRQIVNLQAGRHTPYSRNEIIVDYLSLGEVKNVYTKILLLIVPIVAVKRYYELAQRARLKVDRICFAPEATAMAIDKNVKLSEKGPTALVNIDRTNTEFLVMEKGSVLFLRAIPMGAQHMIAEKEAAVNRFVAELKRSIESYENEKIAQNPAIMLITGANGEIQAIEAKAKSELTMNVRCWQQGNDISIRPGTRKACERPAISFVDVMMPALYADDVKADLTPEEMKLQKAIETRNKEILKTGVLSMISVGLICGIFLSHFYFKKAEVDQIKARFAPIKSEAEGLQTMSVKLRMLEEFLSTRGKSLEAFATLFEVIPSDAYLTEIRYQEDEMVSIKGTGLSRSSIFSMVDKLEQTSLFKNVQTRYVSGRTEGGKVLADFQIVTSFE